MYFNWLFSPLLVALFMYLHVYNSNINIDMCSFQFQGRAAYLDVCLNNLELNKKVNYGENLPVLGVHYRSVPYSKDRKFGEGRVKNALVFTNTISQQQNFYG